MTFIADNTAILDQHNNLVHKKSCFKTSAAVFLILKDKQYIFKVNVVNSIDFMIADLIMQFIEMFVNVLLSNNLTMMISDSVTCKLLEFK